MFKCESFATTFFHADCYNLFPLIPDQSVDLILTDPPYHTSECSWDVQINIAKMWEAFNRIIKPNGVVAIFGIDIFAAKTMIANEKYYRYKWIWNKVFAGNFANFRVMPMKNFEEILIFYQKPVTYNMQMIQRDSSRIREHSASKYKYVNVSNQSDASLGLRKNTKPYLIDFGKYNPDKKYPECIIEGIPQIRPNSAEKVDHSTQKPIEIMEYFINTYTTKNMLVFDPFLGSGTTLLAAMNTHRRCIGSELNPNYITIILDRIKNKFSNACYISKQKKEVYEQYDIKKPLDMFFS